jgi:DNA-binding transcriptional ArsR family regulator
MGPIRRDVAHRNERLATGADPTAVVVEATNGYEPPDDAGPRRIVLLPSYWMRPWLVLGHHGTDTEVISTVVADQFLVLPSEAPPPALLKLAKALSDESRLKLLRRMASGPISLTEATDALDVAKATAHHHLSILRQAGLVSMRGTGRSTRYALRTDPAARDALSTLLMCIAAGLVHVAEPLNEGESDGPGRDGGSAAPHTPARQGPATGEVATVARRHLTHRRGRGRRRAEVATVARPPHTPATGRGPAAGRTSEAVAREARPNPPPTTSVVASLVTTER